MANKSELIKIDQLGLCRCHGIQAPASLGFHLLMGKARGCSNTDPERQGWGGNGANLSRESPLSSQVNRGGPFPSHIRYLIFLPSLLKSVNYLDGAVTATGIS